MSETRCAVCGEHCNPHERPTNRLMAEMAQWPTMAAAVRAAIWPDADGHARWTNTTLPAFRESGRGADWRLHDVSGQVVYQAENKPSGAAAHCCWGYARDYARAVFEGIILPSEGWRGISDCRHEQPHKQTEDCRGRCRGIPGKPGVCRLAIPRWSVTGSTPVCRARW